MHSKPSSSFPSSVPFAVFSASPYPRLPHHELPSGIPLLPFISPLPSFSSPLHPLLSPQNLKTFLTALRGSTKALHKWIHDPSWIHCCTSDGWFFALRSVSGWALLRVEGHQHHSSRICFRFCPLSGVHLNDFVRWQPHLIDFFIISSITGSSKISYEALGSCADLDLLRSISSDLETFRAPQGVRKFAPWSAPYHRSSAATFDRVHSSSFLPCSQQILQLAINCVLNYLLGPKWL